jgi:hypothetical protein
MAPTVPARRFFGTLILFMGLGFNFGHLYRDLSNDAAASISVGACLVYGILFFWPGRKDIPGNPHP